MRAAYSSNPATSSRAMLNTRAAARSSDGGDVEHLAKGRDLVARHLPVGLGHFRAQCDHRDGEGDRAFGRRAQPLEDGRKTLPLGERGERFGYAAPDRHGHSVSAASRRRAGGSRGQMAPVPRRISEDFLHQHEVVPAPELAADLREARDMGIAEGGVKPGCPPRSRPRLRRKGNARRAPSDRRLDRRHQRATQPAALRPGECGWSARTYGRSPARRETGRR
jgi:hypothetical protein